MSTPPSVRMSISLTRPQREVLKEEAQRLGISVGDLIRRIVDDWRERRRQQVRRAQKED